MLYELLSLDGVAEDPDKFVVDWDEAMDTNLASVIASQDAVILGRRSYEEWSEFWPGSEIEPFATFINHVAKYVATSTPLRRQWHNAMAIEGGLAQFVQDLKNSPGGDIGVHASISVAQALLAADVIDEVRLVVAPAIVALGDGSWTGCRRFASCRSAARCRRWVTCLPTMASRGDLAHPELRSTIGRRVTRAEPGSPRTMLCRLASIDPRGFPPCRSGTWDDGGDEQTRRAGLT